MNKKLTSTVLALTLLAGTTPAFAEETTSQTETNINAGTEVSNDTATQTTEANANATITSDSTATTAEAVNPDSLLYKLKDLLKQIQLLFTFNDQAKADLLIEQANEKIKELESLNQNNTTEYNEKLLETIHDTLEKAQEILKEAKVEAESEQDESAKIEIAAKETTAVQTEKHSLVVLKSLLNKVPEQGKKGIANAISKQEAKLKSKTESATDENTETAANSETAANTEVSVNSDVSATPAASSEQTTESTVEIQVPVLEGSLKVKQDNGLHLGQSKQQENSKQEKHQEKHQEKQKD
jgi:hypothetical protein